MSSSKNDDTSKNETAGFQGNNQGVIITEKIVPHSQESNKDAQVANGQSSGFIFSANGKAQIGGPYKNGPYARKYKWVRTTPPNSAQVTKKIIADASNKRKTRTNSAIGPIKKKAGKGKEKAQAEVSFNSEGFYEVHVQYDHLSKLAAGCGFKNNEVEEVIKADNAQRQSQAVNRTDQTSANSDEEEVDPSRFEPDPNDELTSEEEEA